MNVLALDTSIRACGVGLFAEGRLSWTTLRPPTDGVLEYRSEQLVSSLQDWIRGHLPLRNSRIHCALVEMPSFQDSERGRIAAAGGGLVKLGFVAGYLASFLARCSVVDRVHLVLPVQWKGCLSKLQTRQRLEQHPAFQKTLEGARYDHNAADAMGMIQWWLSRQRRHVFSKPTIIYL